jgi:glycosyltransferase involved in cell wall biosynthesis
VNVLFISSGNSANFAIAPFSKSQGESLKAKGIRLKYYPIVGKGLSGYVQNILPLKKYLKQHPFDLIHAHYALTGWVALMTLPRTPVVVSYMGCDTYGDYDEKGRRVLSSYVNIVLSKILQLFVKKIIVKSRNLEAYIFCKKKVALIPNGVNLNVFKSMDKVEARKNLGLNLGKNYILFLGNPEDKRKNFPLVYQAQQICKQPFEIIKPYPVLHHKIPWYLNACDVMVLSSFNEGSPNVIKEAMACNCPIVSVDVGDVKEIIAGTDGCYTCSYDTGDVAEKIKLALEFGRRTTGRDKIRHLDESMIAQKIIKIYENVLSGSSI